MKTLMGLVFLFSINTAFSQLADTHSGSKTISFDENVSSVFERTSAYTDSITGIRDLVELVIQKVSKSDNVQVLDKEMKSCGNLCYIVPVYYEGDYSLSVTIDTKVIIVKSAPNNISMRFELGYRPKLGYLNISLERMITVLESFNALSNETILKVADVSLKEGSASTKMDIKLDLKLYNQAKKTVLAEGSTNILKTFEDVIKDM
jgi:hypothetical protein